MDRRNFLKCIGITAMPYQGVLALMPKPKPGYLLRLQPKDVVTKEIIINIRVSNLRMVQAAIQANATEIQKIIGKHIEIVSKHRSPVNE